MERSDIETLRTQAEHRALVMVLHAHPDWTLGQIHELLARGPRAAALRKLTIGELITGLAQASPDSANE